jgi:hypothetical protein
MERIRGTMESVNMDILRKNWTQAEHLFFVFL